MSKRGLRNLALGFLISAVILAGYRTFLYPKETAAKDAKQETKQKSDKLSASEKSYKKKYEELLLQTELDGLDKDDSASDATTIATNDKDKDKNKDKAKNAKKDSKGNKKLTAAEKKKAEEAKKKAEAEQKEKEAKEKADANKEYTLVIAPGEASGTAVQKLKENGIIDDAEEFTKFLQNNNFEEKVRDGSYKVKKGMGYDQIARIITAQE